MIDSKQAPVISSVEPRPPICVLRSAPGLTRRRLTIRGAGFPAANHGLQFLRLADGDRSIIFDMEVEWLTSRLITLDMAQIADLLWPDRVVRLAVRLIDTTGANYRPISDWSDPFILADDAAACGMLGVAAIGIDERRPIGDRTWRDLHLRLEVLGFFDYAETGIVGELALIADKLDTFYALCHAWQEYPTLRSWSADGEDLAEGGIVEWLARLRPFFAAQGLVVAATQALDAEAPSYVVTVNAATHTIYSPDELPAVGAWATAAIRALAIVEEVLVEGGSGERVYAPATEFGGNGGQMVILTPAMAEAINASVLITEQERLLSIGELVAWLT